MNTGIIARAQRDIQRITSNTDSGFGLCITLTAPNAATATVVGIHAKHHLNVDTDGNVVNSKTAHIAVSESLLVAANYPVRNADGEVDLKGHKIQVVDSTGATPLYLVQSWFPDETVGLIVITLEDFE